MKRLLMLAAVVGGLTFAGTASTAEAHPRGGFGGGHRHGHHDHHHGGGHGYHNFGRFGGYGYGRGSGFYIGTPGFQFGIGNSYVQPYYPGWGYGYGYGGCGW